MSDKDFYSKLTAHEKQLRRDTELFRDRSPIEPDSGEAYPEGGGIDANSVDSHLVREVILGAIGNLQQKVAQNRFNQMDALQLEKLLELVKEWPQLAKAVDDLQTWGDQQEAKAAAEKVQNPVVGETVRKLRIALGKG